MRHRVIGWLKWLAGIGALALLVRCFNPAEIGRALAKADPVRVALATALYLVVLCIRSLRWGWLLRDLGIRVPFGRLLRAYVIGSYFNTFVPGGIGADLYKLYDVSRASAKTLRPAAATLVERFTGILSLTLIGFVSILVFRRELPFSPWLLGGITGGIMVAAAVALAAVGRADRIARALARLAPARWRTRLPIGRIARLADVTRDVRGNTRLYVRTFLIGLAMQGVVLVTYYVIATALDPDVPFRLILVFIPLVDLTAMVPITANGMGVKEGLMLYFLQSANLTASFSLSFSLLYRLIDTAYAIAGGILFLTARSARAPAVPPSDGPTV
jgi:uncharacterized protein (TIRG00374 family)